MVLAPSLARASGNGLPFPNTSRRELARTFRQLLHGIAVNCRGCDQNAESPGIVLVVVERLAESVGHRGPGLAGDQDGGGDVPFVPPAQGGQQVSVVGG